MTEKEIEAIMCAVLIPTAEEEQEASELNARVLAYQLKAVCHY